LLAPNTCLVKIKKRRSVENHIGTLHVIVICNGLEMGAMTKPSLATHLKKETVLLKGNSIKVIADNYNAGWHPLNHGV